MPIQATAGSAGADSRTVSPDEPGFTDEARRRLRAGKRAASAGLTDLRDDYEFAQFQGAMLKRSMLAKYQIERTDDEGRVEAAMTGTFNAVVAAAVTLIVGIYVFSQISSTMPTPENSELANATETVKSTTGNAFTLGAVAVIVLVAALILSLIGSGFGGGGGRMRR
jgi:hypothetical protein